MIKVINYVGPGNNLDLFLHTWKGLPLHMDVESDDGDIGISAMASVLSNVITHRCVIL